MVASFWVALSGNASLIASSVGSGLLAGMTRWSKASQCAVNFEDMTGFFRLFKAFLWMTHK